MTHQLEKRFRTVPCILPSGHVMLLCMPSLQDSGANNPIVYSPKQPKVISTQRILYLRHIFLTLLSPPLTYELGVGLLVGGSATNDSVCVAFAVPFVP
jgi:hypothetical protein